MTREEERINKRNGKNKKEEIKKSNKKKEKWTRYKERQKFKIIMRK